MPYTIIGEPSRYTNYSNVSYDYKYPNGLDLKPGSDFHDKLRSKIWLRAQESRNEISKRFDSWNEIDKSLTTYIPLKDKEKILKKEDPTKPVSIIFPYSYSMLEALLTYMTMAFFQDPIFRYEGVDDEDTIGAMLLEQVIKIHCIKTKVPLAIHTILRDAFGYGVGIGIPGWTTKFGRVPIRSTATTEGDLGTSSEKFVNFIDKKIFEGNNLSSIDPYMWLPDPSVSSDRIQDGEFNGWVDRDNYMNMLSEESLPNSGIFNVKYLKHKTDKRSSLSMDQSDRQKKFGGSADSSTMSSTSTNNVDNIKMYINLIPSEWKLGPGEYPEKWFFCLSSDDVITQCERADHNHGMYPMAVASPEYDGYSITPIGRMEVLYGLQHTLDFLFNSHVANVRKSINDMLIVDPYLVNINDLKSPEPGKLIRLRRPAWGRGVDKVVQQLGVQDITRANIADSTYITQWMDRISGADQSMQGSLRQGGPERLTGAEFQGTRGSAVSRLQRLAMIIGMQFMQDIGTMFAVHTQQYMTQETFIKIDGPYEQQLRKIYGDKNSVHVSPYDISINYDMIVRDGSIPGGNFSQSWLQMFKIVSDSPQLMQEFDVTRIFMYIASQLGAKNVGDFKRNLNNIQMTTMPDNQVQDQLKAGNIVPTGA